MHVAQPHALIGLFLRSVVANQATDAPVNTMKRRRDVRVVVRRYS